MLLCKRVDKADLAPIICSVISEENLSDLITTIANSNVCPLERKKLSCSVLGSDGRERSSHAERKGKEMPVRMSNTIESMQYMCTVFR